MEHNLADHVVQLYGMDMNFLDDMLGIRNSDANENDLIYSEDEVSSKEISLPVNNSPTILQRTITDEQSVHQHTRATDLENGNALKDLVLPNFFFYKI